MSFGMDLKSERVYKEFSCTNRPGHVQTWVDSDYAHVGTFQAIWPKLRHLCGICVSPISPSFGRGIEQAQWLVLGTIHHIMVFMWICMVVMVM